MGHIFEEFYENKSKIDRKIVHWFLLNTKLYAIIIVKLMRIVRL